MEQYYGERVGRDGIPATVEMIYHVNRQDWERGVNRWTEAFEQALELSRYKDCRALLEIRTKLRVESDVAHGNVSYNEGEYLDPTRPARSTS